MRRAIVTNGSVGVDVDVPERASERMRGLIGAPPGRALLLATRSVHTFGMRRPIDVVLLDIGFRVRGVFRLAPRRVLLPRPRVRHVLEVDASPFVVGDHLRVHASQRRPAAGSA